MNDYDKKLSIGITKRELFVLFAMHARITRGNFWRLTQASIEDANSILKEISNSKNEKN
jgi:hypothetical protein